MYNYNFDLFDHKNNTSYPLLLFIFYNCDIKDPYVDEEEPDLIESHIY